MDGFLNQARAFANNAGSAARSFGAAAQAGASAAVREAKTAMASTSPAANLVGSVVPLGGREYYVESLLAEGGFGSVYAVSVYEGEEAHGGGSGGVGGGSRPPKERLVLKRMFAGSPELVKQLQGEVKLMRQLQGHPNIVRVVNAESRRVGEGADISVLMELCPGGHLLTRINALREGKRVLPMQKVLEVFLQIVRPVAHMHACAPPIAHRDLKVRAARCALPSPPPIRPLRPPHATLPHTPHPSPHPPPARSLKTFSSQRTARCGCVILAPRARTRACATQRRTA
jgi:hypothetical protein